MPYSYTQYTVSAATASSKTFALGFDYLRTTHITTTVEGTGETDFTVDEAGGTLTFGAGVTLTDGDSLTITRTTPAEKSERVVDFSDGSILSQDDLDDSALQLLYISQEAFDLTADTLGKDTADGQWTAGGLRIKDLALPTASSDAVRKTDLDAAIIGAGNLPAVSSSDNDDGLFVNAGDWAVRSPAQSRTHLGLGTASLLNSGTATGEIPILDAVGYPSTISGAQIPNILAEGISACRVQWGATPLTWDATAGWEGTATRLGTGTIDFINNGPTTGGTYFTDPGTNIGIDIAEGIYLVMTTILAHESSSSGEAHLKLTMGSSNYLGGTSTGVQWENICAGLTLARAGAGSVIVDVTTFSTTTLVSTAGVDASDRSIALFGCDATAGAAVGTIQVKRRRHPIHLGKT